jgi:hypothetical protein
MKHIQTFENFLNEATAFKEGDFVKWVTPQTGNQISFGVVTKVYANSFAAKVIATGGKGNEQPSRGLALGLGGPVIWKPGISADKLNKEIKQLDANTNIADKIRFEKASIWNINENQVNEASSFTIGPKAKKFDSMVDSTVITFKQAEQNEKEEGGELPKEYYAALKTLGIKDTDAAVCFSASIGSADALLNAAKKAGIKYVEVTDSETNDLALVFAAKQ